MKNYWSTKPHILCNFRSVLPCENLQLSILGASVKLNFSQEGFLSFIDLSVLLDELPTYEASCIIEIAGSIILQHFCWFSLYNQRV